MGVLMKKMQLNVGGHNYTIMITPLEHEDDDKELYGRHLVKNNIILINEEIEDSRQKETLMHEILHAVYYNTGLEQEYLHLKFVNKVMFLYH